MSHDERSSEAAEAGQAKGGGELYPHPFIAREGWPFIALGSVVAAAATWFGGAAWSVPLWAIVVFMVQFFRDPARIPPAGGNLVISPADGRIVSVGRVEDPYLKREAEIGRAHV